MNLILTISDCRNNLAAIQTMIEQQVAQEPSMLMTYLSDLSAMLGTSAQTVASMNHHFNTAKLMAIQNCKKDGYNGNMAKMYVEGLTAEIGAELKLSERQNAAITHRIDAIRSILSFTKQELFNANQQA